VSAGNLEKSGSRSMTCASMSGPLSPSNAGRPGQHLESTHPYAQMSVRLSELDVGGLEIAVDDAAQVGRLERLGDLSRDDGPVGGRCFLEAVDAGNMRMVEGGEHLRLALEAGSSIRVAGERLGQDLQRHITIKPRVARAIDLTIPPRPIEAVTW
jgi:hypothetical protein